MANILPDFPNLLSQFNESINLEFKGLLEVKEITPDQFLYKIETDKGVMYVYEVDYVGSLKGDVLDIIGGEIEEEFRLATVITPNVIFEETSPYKRASIYVKPKDWENISLYANDKYGSYTGYFNFLAMT